MKNYFIILLSFLSFSTAAQTISYSDLVDIKSRPLLGFDEYISKDGHSYTVGDTIFIKNPSGINGSFIYISRISILGDTYGLGSEARNTSAVIKNFRVWGTRRSGWKMSVQTQGFTGIDNYFVLIENAIETGEIDANGMTRDIALAELKKAKKKLDLELITQEEYDKIKEDLREYID